MHRVRSADWNDLADRQPAPIPCGPGHPPRLHRAQPRAAYYYVFLLLWLLVFRLHPIRLAFIFGVEALFCCLLLFEEHEGQIFINRSRWYYSR